MTREGGASAADRALNRLERNLRGEIGRLRAQLDASVDELGLTPGAVERVVQTALELARQPALRADTIVRDGHPTAIARVFHVPPLTRIWALTAPGSRWYTSTHYSPQALRTPWSTSERLLPYRAAQLTHLELRPCRLLLLGPDPHRQGTRLHNLPIHGFTQNQISCKLVVWEDMRRWSGSLTHRMS